ncbi:hypothetical protein MS3_00002167 [Schistosoma haematobium]|uniref:Uncharacterized protein n=2 Tax=Schistosoma TaxID=6181 RepID=A0A922LZ84_SCHHA|nr:hypothetical protein MS3_00002167 [Schistosoma haematobium]KAH9596511.1 hypothetical protein MS3_00002167 [Schistosoma haematobium]CAH8487124.1 unnamed protein product [Schistosoma haematobium]CAH8488503.1 unnamed protein product [Schistosoma haematobium]
MKFLTCIVMTILLFMVRIDDSLSASCFTCNPCPTPFNPGSNLIRNKTGCRWCAKIEPNGYPYTVRDCVDVCEANSWFYMFSKYSYQCCTRDYCNKSHTNYPPLQMITIIIFAICFYINKMNSKM